jgi:acylglycerol kinase
MVIKFLKWVGRNPKKSIFFGSILAYGGDYFHQKYQIATLMRSYCEEAKKYGDAPAPVTSNLKKVLVLLNPAANKRNAEEDFTDYCAPILNLAGYMIDIVKTQSDMHAISYMEEELKETYDAFIIAGGDGTVSEALTGLMRREDGIGSTSSIGVLPLGRTNLFSLMLHNSNPKVRNRVEEVKAMAESSLAIVKGNTKKQDVMKIELISDDEQEQVKTFFAVGSIQWGSFYDIMRKKDKYWITGSLRNYSACLFNGIFPREGVTWNVNAKLQYSEPCLGCSNCYDKVVTRNQRLHNSRWWSKFNAKEVVPEYSKILNPNCLQSAEIDMNNSSEFAITTNIVEGQVDNASKLNIKMNESADNYSFSYIWNSWKRVSNGHHTDIPDSKTISARTVTLLPQSSSDVDKESFFAIDNNSFEVRPIKVTVLPKRANFFVL